MNNRNRSTVNRVKNTLSRPARATNCTPLRRIVARHGLVAQPSKPARVRTTCLRLAVTLALSALLLLTACSIGPTSPRIVRVGAVYPLGGSLAATGTDIRQGANLALEIINNHYELDLPLAADTGLSNLKGAKLEIVWADHGGDPARGAAQAERLLQEEDVVALLGSYNSSVTAQASQVAEAAGVPFVNATSTSPLLIDRGFRWFFRTTADDTIFVRDCFDFLADVEDRYGESIDSIALVYENSLFGTSVSRLEMEHAQAAGIPVVADIPYSAQTTDVTDEVRRVMDSRADLVMHASYSKDAILFMQTYKELGYRPKAILAMDAGFISPAFVETLGADANYILSREAWARDLGESRPMLWQINALYQQKYGTDMTGNSARVFTAVLILADAINRAGSTEPEAIREALLATDIPPERLIMPWDGVRFDPATGQNVLAQGIIVQVQEEKYYTVWPWEVASHDLIWPMPDWGR